MMLSFHYFLQLCVGAAHDRGDLAAGVTQCFRDFRIAVLVPEGGLLADRAMSRLLKDDWPRSLDEMERHFESRRE